MGGRRRGSGTTASGAAEGPEAARVPHGQSDGCLRAHGIADEVGLVDLELVEEP